MSTQLFFFYLYAAIAVAGAIGLVVAKRLIHAVMSMFATLFAIAALYLVIGSEFLAAMQLFVYGGAITVLVLFVLMLTRQGADQQQEEERESKPLVRWVAMGLCLVLFGVLSFTVGTAQWNLAAGATHSTASLASILFSRYVLPFEIAGLALTIALIGAIVLAREDDVLDVAAEQLEGSSEIAQTPLAEDAALVEDVADAGEPA